MDKKIIKILQELTGSNEVADDENVDLFQTGLLDSMATVQLLLELQDEFDIDVPISEFERGEWNTPKKIIEKVVALKA